MGRIELSRRHVALRGYVDPNLLLAGMVSSLVLTAVLMRREPQADMGVRHVL